MQTSKIKNIVIVALLACIAILTTCNNSGRSQSEIIPLQDTIFLNQWRREKKAKQELIVRYEKIVGDLQKDKDSLQKLVVENKKSISAYRFKAKQFENQLREKLAISNPTNASECDSITPLLDSLTVAQAGSNEACDTTIYHLENIVANQDSSIQTHKQIEGSLRDLNAGVELKNQYLTEQLNHALKVQRKKTRQNKILAGGLLLLTGITTSIILIHPHN